MKSPEQTTQTEHEGTEAEAAGRGTKRPLEGLFPDPAKIIWRNRKARVGIMMLVIFVLVAVFAPLIAPYDPQFTGFSRMMSPSGKHLLGTTQAGEDVFSQLIYGTRTSMLVGIVAGGLATVVALVVGLTAGYMQGPVDEFLSFLTNVALVIPALPLMIVLAAYAPVKGVFMIVFVIAITGWAWGARVKRSQMVSLRNRDYVTAAIFAGESTPRIIFREIMPNMTSLIVAGYIGASIAAIQAEAGLEFLGLGDPSIVSWGTMLYWAQNSGALLSGQWAWLAASGLSLALLSTALTLINFGIDALSNPHLREE